MSAPQVRPVPQNSVRILWTDDQCLFLIDQRLSRNDEFWELSPVRRRRFW